MLVQVDQTSANFGQIWATVDQARPSSTNFGHASADLGRCWPNFGQTWATFGQDQPKSICVCQTLADADHTSATLRPNSGQIWPIASKLHQSWPNFAEFWPALADAGQQLADFVQMWAYFRRCRPTSTKLWLNLDSRGKQSLDNFSAFFRELGSMPGITFGDMWRATFRNVRVA